MGGCGSSHKFAVDQRALLKRIELRAASSVFERISTSGPSSYRDGCFIREFSAEKVDWPEGFGCTMR